MAFPVLASFTENERSDGGSTLNMTPPSGIQVGDLLIVVARRAGSTNMTGMSGWTKLVDNVAALTGDDKISIWYKFATGSETWDISWSFDFTHLVAIAMRITGAKPATAPYITSQTGATSQDFDMGQSFSPAPGAKDYLWIHACTAQGAKTLQSGLGDPPTTSDGDTFGGKMYKSNSGVDASDRAEVYVWWLQKNDDNIDVGPANAHWVQGANRWDNWTMAIEPADVAGGYPKTLVVM